jgi:hypothetical protein
MVMEKDPVVIIQKRQVMEESLEDVEVLLGEKLE